MSPWVPQRSTPFFTEVWQQKCMISCIIFTTIFTIIYKVYIFIKHVYTLKSWFAFVVDYRKKIQSSLQIGLIRSGYFSHFNACFHSYFVRSQSYADRISIRIRISKKVLFCILFYDRICIFFLCWIFENVIQLLLGTKQMQHTTATATAVCPSIAQWEISEKRAVRCVWKTHK